MRGDAEYLNRRYAELRAAGLPDGVAFDLARGSEDEMHAIQVAFTPACDACGDDIADDGNTLCPRCRGHVRENGR